MLDAPGEMKYRLRDYLCDHFARGVLVKQIGAVEADAVKLCACRRSSASERVDFAAEASQRRPAWRTDESRAAGHQDFHKVTRAEVTEWCRRIELTPAIIEFRVARKLDVASRLIGRRPASYELSLETDDGGGAYERGAAAKYR